MWCPFCSSDQTRVVDSRLTDTGDTVRRRRECQACHERFTTFERPELRLPQIIKSDGRREPFSELKLRRGIRRALEKRPVDSDAVEAAVHGILHQMTVSGEREMPSAKVGEAVMIVLRDLDEVAYVRFASVYRRFQDVEAFSEEVERLRTELSAAESKRQLSFLPGPETPCVPDDSPD
jgi:transcriptional repressor NrdR